MNKSIFTHTPADAPEPFADEPRAVHCRHPYDKRRFSACPYCSPPAYEDIRSSRIKRLHLSARMIAGDYKRIEYDGGRLKYAQGLRTIATFSKEVPFTDAQLDRLSDAIIACHIEQWRSYDSSKPMSLGISQPWIEAAFENGRLLVWQNSAPQNMAALARAEQILSDALGLRFNMMG